ncbi:MAG: DUF6702 family protein [Bacteroidota bacterium]
MKPQFHTSIALIGLLFAFSVFKRPAPPAEHPLKLSASLIKYDDEAKSIRMECRVFIDDFERCINQTLSSDINVSNLSTEDKRGIENYFCESYLITVNGTKLPLNYESSEVNSGYNTLTINFSETPLSLKKGDKVWVKNTILFEEFQYTQVNRITLHLLPLLAEHNHQAEYGYETVTLKL